MIPPEKWKWYGHALHFICGDRCMFHMGTKVGKYVISTVGEMMRLNHETDGKPLNEFENVGYNRKFETMVFRAAKLLECGCPGIVPTELDFEGYNDSGSAMRGHMRMCKKWAAKQ